MTATRHQPTPRGGADGPLGRPPGIDWTPARPDCPECWRTWPAGSLPAKPLLSLRTGAALASALMALTAPGPALALAAQRLHASGHGPQQADPSDPGYEPDGPEADAPVAPEEPEAPDDPESDPPPAAGATPAPPPQEPGGPDAGPSPADSGQQSPDTGDTEPGSGEPPPAPNGQDSAPEAPPTPAVGAPAPPVTPPVAAHATPALPTVGLRGNRKLVMLRPRVRDGGPRAAPHAYPIKARLVNVATSSPPMANARSPIPAGEQVRPGSHTHVVRPGESLWSIAADVLGQDASSARVAREVSRLWRLNRARIGTGDADLLMVGTKLVLR